MSLESLLAQEPTCILKRLPSYGEVDDEGKPLDAETLITVRQVVGRVMMPSGNQQLVYQQSALMVAVTYYFLTQDREIENGWFLVSGWDSRVFRFVGVGIPVYTKGNIPEHSKYPMQLWQQV